MTAVLELLRVPNVSRKIGVKGRAVLNLREEVPGRPERKLHVRAGLLLKLSDQFLEGKIQIRRRGDGQVLCRARRQRREERQCRAEGHCNREKTQHLLREHGSHSYESFRFLITSHCPTVGNDASKDFHHT